MEDSKLVVHHLTDMLQMTMGYMELGQHHKATAVIKDAAELLHRLAGMMAATVLTTARDKAEWVAAEHALVAAEAERVAQVAAEVAKTEHVQAELASCCASLEAMKSQIRQWRAMLSEKAA